MKLVWSRFALSDRDGIFSYIEAENPRAAVHVDEQIANAARRLLDFPDSGRTGRVAGTLGHSAYILCRGVSGRRRYRSHLARAPWRADVARRTYQRRLRRLRTVPCDQLDGQVSIYCLYRRLATISTIKLNLQDFVSRACRTNKGLGQRLERDRSFRHTLGRWKRPLRWISTARHFCWCLFHLDETAFLPSVHSPDFRLYRTPHAR